MRCLLECEGCDASVTDHAGRSAAFFAPSRWLSRAIALHAAQRVHAAERAAEQAAVAALRASCAGPDSAASDGTAHSAETAARQAAGVGGSGREAPPVDAADVDVSTGVEEDTPSRLVDYVAVLRQVQPVDGDSAWSAAEDSSEGKAAAPVDSSGMARMELEWMWRYPTQDHRDFRLDELHTTAVADMAPEKSGTTCT